MSGASVNEGEKVRLGKGSSSPRISLSRQNHRIRETSEPKYQFESDSFHLCGINRNSWVAFE